MQSGRSMCKKCQKAVKEDTPRIGMYVQSRFFDGATPMWYHAECSLNAHVGKKLLDINSVIGLDTLRWDDQEKIRKKFEKIIADIKASGEVINADGLRVEYAKSGGSTCRGTADETLGCEEKIEKGLVRLGFLVDGPYGPIPAWHHIDCFITHHADKCVPIEQFTGHKYLEQEDLDILHEKLKGIGGKVKAEENPVEPKETSDNVDEKELKKQNKQLWDTKDKLKKSLIGKEALLYILQVNGIVVEQKTEAEMIDIVADSICFGLAPTCEQCQKTRYMWSQALAIYKCPTLHGWGSCPGQIDPESIAKFSKFAFPKDSVSSEFIKKKLPALLKRVYHAHKSPAKKLMSLDELKSQKRKLEGNTDSEQERKVKMKVKGRFAVDPDSELADTHHVYEDKATKTVYAVTLAVSDAETGRNSYYNIQLLEGDWVGSVVKKRKGGKGSAAYYVFRKWGRVGTDIGDSRIERCESLDESIEQFMHHYEHKTGNVFGEPFEKKPFMFYPMELEVVNPIVPSENAIIPGSKTNLDKSIQDLLLLIFDVEAMKRTLLELEIDGDKMPLGLISKSQLKKAYTVLNDIAKVLQDKKSTKESFTSFTNQFYTLIPHNFGHGKIQMINDESILKQKIQLLDTLMDFEVASRILKDESTADNADKDPLDLHYESLNADITVLGPKSNEFKNIKKYLETTHAPTHNEYSLELLNVYMVSRSQESDIFDSFVKSNPKVQDEVLLLWHGSRLTNYAGIISQGLRIAPPEAPVTGYMFGKGVYFADMVSKSANYCCTTPDDNIGLLVLSEVALGNQYELKESEYIDKLPPGFHSTKGCGKTIPKSMELFGSKGDRSNRRTRSGRGKVDPKDSNNDMIEVKFPVGPPAENKKLKDSELLYNEYIVYDTRQIRMRYLVQVKFNYKKKGKR